MRGPQRSVRQSSRHIYRSRKRCSCYARGIDYNSAIAAANGMTAIEQNGSFDEEINELLTYYSAAALRSAKQKRPCG